MRFELFGTADTVVMRETCVAAVGRGIASTPALEPPPPASFPVGTGAVKLTTHFYLVPRLRMHGAVPPFSIRLHDLSGSIPSPVIDHSVRDFS
jgi:hypothetical protein